MSSDNPSGFEKGHPGYQRKDSVFHDSSDEDQDEEEKAAREKLLDNIEPEAADFFGEKGPVRKSKNAFSSG